MIARALFLKALAGATTLATGGIDVWDPLSPQIRVLVANETHGETPQGLRRCDKESGAVRYQQLGNPDALL